MELIQDLPEVFEEFAEQRKNSFLAVKKLKEKGIPVVGAYCTYFPQEIAMAAGAATVGLCSTSDETIQEAEKDLPKNPQGAAHPLRDVFLLLRQLHDDHFGSFLPGASGTEAGGTAD